MLIEHIEALCRLSGVSGRESAVREYLQREIPAFCECTVDPLGNLLVFQKGKARASHRVLLDAHMDEVGLFITGVTEDGFLRFSTAGGIDSKVLHGRRVRIGKRYGVIGVKPVHLLDKEEAAKPLSADNLLIDIGAKTREEGLPLIGKTAVFDSEFIRVGDRIFGKALDDRLGCAVLLELLQQEQPFDVWISFSVQEELGTKGAMTASDTVNPDVAIVVEGTTAADVPGVASGKEVCRLGNGPAVSFLDGGACYDPELYKICFEQANAAGLTLQPKAAATGGNNAHAIQTSRGGVRTAAVSVPCRYIHGPYGVADWNDVQTLAALLPKLAARLAE